MQCISVKTTMTIDRVKGLIKGIDQEIGSRRKRDQERDIYLEWQFLRCKSSVHTRRKIDNYLIMECGWKRFHMPLERSQLDVRIIF